MSETRAEYVTNTKPNTKHGWIQFNPKSVAEFGELINGKTIAGCKLDKIGGYDSIVLTLTDGSEMRIQFDWCYEFNNPK